MARTQSKKRCLLGFAKTSNSASGLASSPGRSETRVGDFSSIPETSGLASPGRLARMKRFFHRSNQGPSTASATEIIDTQDSVGAQVAPDQDVSNLPHAINAMALSGSMNRLPQQSLVVGRKSNKRNPRRLRPRTYVICDVQLRHNQVILLDRSKR
ncbi:hypothetical protein F5141DRAFT_453882 [Pisolithus sp. B1]|nr:hypothetical protein F5141DRAFT_453882 [Pisolithus sp. B1]